MKNVYICLSKVNINIEVSISNMVMEYMLILFSEVVRAFVWGSV